jgi:hypothetical protein
MTIPELPDTLKTEYQFLYENVPAEIQDLVSVEPNWQDFNTLLDYTRVMDCE